MAAPPPKWGSPTALDPGTDTAKGFGLPNAIAAGSGLGGALGYWLPHGINRAKTATKRLVKAAS